jgi:anti-sigma regulatory factor (Ser/Thr protein kinase)
VKTESHDFLSDVRQVAAIRSVVRDRCRRKWETEKDLEAISQLELAVQEAAANIIEHAYKGRSDQSIQLVVALEERTASVSLYDQGLGFDADAVEPPRFDGTRIGGFGLYMIRECVDEVLYSREADGRNVVRLVKRLGS